MKHQADGISKGATFRDDPHRTKVNQVDEATPRQGSLLYPFLAPPQTPDEIGRLGAYRVLSLLGKGGMGLVFHAEDMELHRRVALKVILPEIDLKGSDAGQRFLREARAMAAVKHDNLVTVYQAGRDRDTVFMAMELLDGETVDAWLNRIGQPSVKEILRIAKETASGLVAIHERGLIHRDIKPANLWREDPSGRVKILDFGLARVAEQETQLTATGMIVGTPAYLSPEQARGKPLDQRSDLFSFGCVLYRLCTGSIPFPADNTLDQLAALAADDPVPIRQANPSLAEPLADLVMELLAKKPEDRPVSAKVVVNRLSRIQRPSGAHAKKPMLARRSAEGREDATERLARMHPTRRRGKTWRTTYRRAAIAVCALLGLTTFLWVGIGPWRLFGSAETASSIPLTDMPKISTVGWPLSKGGFGKKGPQGDDKKGPLAQILAGVIVQGRRSPSSIFMHPAPHFEPPASITFKIDKQYRTFQATTTMNDTAPPDPAPVQFAVFGDGKLLWQSRPISTQSEAQTCEVSVANITALKLEVTVGGEPKGSHAVWVDPLLMK